MFEGVRNKAINQKTPEECATAICNFARAYRAENVKKTHELYLETGYAEHGHQIMQEMIEAVLLSEPLLVDHWIRFSEDKRWSPAWCIETDMTGNFRLFHVSAKGRTDYEVRYQDPAHACALMVRMEMEDFRHRMANQSAWATATPRLEDNVCAGHGT